jgi:hypothetical protein
MSPEGLGGEPAEDIIAHARADRRFDSQAGEIHRRIGGAAADIQDQVVDGHELTRLGQVVQRWANMIGDD